MKQLFIELGVSQDRISVDLPGRDTSDSAENLSNLISDEDRCAIVTSAGHLPRAVLSFHKKGIKCKYLYNQYAKEFGEISKKYPLSEVRYMKKDLITHGWIEIYADTVTIGLNKEKSFSVVIQNQEVADSFRIYAQLLWGLSKS